MGKKALAYAAGLIFVYLAVEYATGFSKDVGAGSAGGVNLVKAFQGR
ncbi:MAG: hypothetical protein JWP34_4564 [Massilia sp.]|nr:hypothetical protein [Gemmatimonadales bacterium]MDB5910450.1 hypothetical protein [Massilia sp.]